MKLNWLSFPIDLNSFKTWLDVNVPNSDGIVAEPNSFTIVEKVTFTINDINNINNYINSLSSSSEASKIDKIKTFPDALNKFKTSILTTEFSNLTTLQKKVLLGLTLTDQDINNIYNS